MSKPFIFVLPDNERFAKSNLSGLCIMVGLLHLAMLASESRLGMSRARGPGFLQSAAGCRWQLLPIGERSRFLLSAIGIKCQWASANYSNRWSSLLVACTCWQLLLLPVGGPKRSLRNSLALVDCNSSIIACYPGLFVLKSVQPCGCRPLASESLAVVLRFQYLRHCASHAISRRCPWASSTRSRRLVPTSVHLLFVSLSSGHGLQ